jgi:hypothetical protein
MVDIFGYRKRVQDQRKEITSKSTIRQRDLFDEKRKTLNGRILSFREGREQYMGECSDPNHPSLSFGQSVDPEEAELGLPSSYHPNTIKEEGLSQIAKLEAELRRAVCNDTLEVIRDLLGARALTLKYKNKNLRGEISTTRAEAALRAHTERIYKEQWKYNNSRQALLRLGATADDLKTYDELKKGDLVFLKDWMEVDSRALGQGFVTMPWIWTRHIDIVADDESWQAQGKS